MAVFAPSTSTSVKWNNPLRSSQSDNKKIGPGARTLLKNSVTSQSYSVLSNLYQMDLCKPGPGVNTPQFFAIREQVLAIESYLENKKLVDLSSIRQQVGLLLQCNDYEKKMAELGLLLFYLDRDGALPKSDSLLEYRSQEIKKNVERYATAHSNARANQKIPSGKTHYLLRAFAHMVVTRGTTNQNQIFNCGGLIAIKHLLLKPSLEISKFLQPEHREHILIVVDQILKHPGVANLFKKKVTVHPNLKDIIRLDLKYKFDAPVYSVDAFCSCMMLLFSDIRQQPIPNCYAVGTFIYVTENHTYKILSQLIEWLSDGHFVFNSATKLPIQPIVENRLFDRNDLCIEIEGGEALKLAPFASISRLLNLNSVCNLSGVQSIESCLTQLLKANQVLHLKSRAEKYYRTYKSLAMTQLVFAILETFYLNRGTPSNTTLFSFRKEEFIQACMKGIFPAAEANTPYTPFLKRLQSKLETWLWLENCNETKVEISGNTVRTRSQKIVHFSGNLTHLTEVLKNLRTVFCWIRGQYFPLQSITALQNKIIQAIDEVRNELTEEGEFQDPNLAKKYKSSVRSFYFRRSISQCASKQIGMKGIAAHHLNLNDLLVFKQDGGDFEDTLKSMFGVTTKEYVISKCMTPYQFLEKLMHELGNSDQRQLNTVPRFALTTREHAWTLSGQCWKIFFNNQNNFHNFVQKNVFSRAKARMDQPVSPDLIERVIRCYTQTEAVREAMRASFAETHTWTYRKIKVKLLSGTQDEEDRTCLKKAIESEFSAIEIKKADLELILSKLGVLPGEAQKLDDMMQKIGSGASRPYHFASKLRRLLMEEKIAILNLWDIEKVICKIMNYPQVINVGDINYVDSYREDPAHVHLMIDFSWYSEALAYFERGPEVQTMVTDIKDYDWFNIHYPQ